MQDLYHQQYGSLWVESELRKFGVRSGAALRNGIGEIYRVILKLQYGCDYGDKGLRLLACMKPYPSCGFCNPTRPSHLSWSSSHFSWGHRSVISRHPSASSAVFGFQGLGFRVSRCRPLAFLPLCPKYGPHSIMAPATHRHLPEAGRCH